MELWFYKAKSGDYLDKLIGWYTKGKYSHVELRFHTGSFFSASPRDNGTRFKGFNPNLKHWDVIDLNFKNNQNKEIYSWCIGQVKKKYDWWAIFGHVVNQPKVWEAKDKWYCSEITSYVLKKYGIYDGDVQVNPSVMFKTFAKRFPVIEATENPPWPKISGN